VPSQPPVCLIVDDEPDTCWALEHVLRKQGFASHCALRAAQALRKIRRGGYAVALLDAKLPDMDGLELARRMRAIDPGIRIIVVSGYFYRDDAAIRQAEASALIQGFIGKPFLHAEIVRAVREALADGPLNSCISGSGSMESNPY
jgi:DNA-binding NtrC family response regulator